MRTGEQVKVRLGRRNVERIVEALGKAGWKDRYIEVVSVENYPGLGRKGVLFRGCTSSGARATGLSTQTVDIIERAKDIMDVGIPLNESDFNVLPAAVRAELLKAGLVEVQTEGDGKYYWFNRERCKPYLRQ